MRRLLAICIFFISFLSWSVMAQDNGQKPHGQYSGKPGGNGPAIGTISGSILDTISLQSIEYANIVLLKARDSSLINGNITNKKGEFLLEKVPFGKYILKIKFIGFQEKRITGILVKPGASDVILGKILLQPSSTDLSAVTITGEKRMMEYKLDKKIVNVEKNLNSTGGTAVDVLQTVPSVTVDFDGNVSMRGNSNVTVLIDGRPSSLSGTKLQQIPASSIDNIELITNPSAKYNPEGMTGIINIVLKKKRSTGLNGIVSLNAGTSDKYNGSLNLNYNVGKFNFFGSYDARSDRRKGTGDLHRTTILNDTTDYLHQFTDMIRTGISQNLKLGTDFNFNRKNMLTFSWLYSKNNNSDNETVTNNYTDFKDSLYNYLENYNKEKENGTSQDFSLSYKKNFNKKDELLTADAIFSMDDNTGINALTEQDYNLNYSPPIHLNETPTMQNATTIMHYKNATIQADYTHPFTKDSQLEFGWQSVMRGSDNNYTMENYDYSSNVWNNDTLLSNHFIYNEQYHALYGLYANKFKRLTFQAGIRFEQAYVHAEQKTSNSNFDNNYFSFFPSLHLTFEMDSTSDLQLSYSRRINRPDMEEVNPFVDYSHPGSVNYGNPKLKPEYINSLELGYYKYWKKTTISGDLFYRQINDVMKRVITMDQTTGILNITTENLSSGVSYGIEIVGEQSIFKWWKINANFSYFRTIINGDNINTAMTNSNNSYTAKLTSSATLPKKITVQLNANYRGPMISPQGAFDPMYSADIALKKDIMKEKASIGLRMSDIFNTQKFHMHNSGDGFINDNLRKRETRIVYFNFTYKINGGLKQKQRKHADNGDNINIGGDDY